MVEWSYVVSTTEDPLEVLLALPSAAIGKLNTALLIIEISTS